ncbi:N-acylethanolamine-hydrolyzing acid amidase-like isoform X2 [Dendropsophus ebraccatus]|uniref:N-acylethanolamine-hydrolyzing acid amidase-like isoform X2 n=1 Tax=Dendropsophus ebraccatus TaxID=150705 RepID=UPI003831D0B6
MNWLDHLISFLTKGFPDSWLIRRTLSKCQHLLTAFIRLTETPILNNAYFMVSGTRDGVVITRDRNISVYYSYLDPGKEKWYLVQTNCDSFLKPCQSYPRRSTTIKTLKENKKDRKKFDSNTMEKDDHLFNSNERRIPTFVSNLDKD